QQSSRFDDPSTGYSTARKCVAGIDNQARVVGDEPVIESIMIGCDENRITAGDDGVIERNRAAALEMGIFTGRRNLHNKGIVVVNRGATLLEQFHELERRAFADIGNVSLE